MLHYKKLLVTVCLTATVVFAATASMQTAEPEKPHWKNLKVLPKTLTEKEMDKVMDEWRDALGVRCGFCHARNKETNKMDFASDEKPEKLQTRDMMKMTDKINKKYFKADKNEKELTAAVTCYTCHNGTAHPETVAPKRKGQGAPGQQGPRPQQTPPAPAPQAPPVQTTPPAR